MRAAVLTGPGLPLVLEDLPTPEPHLGEVLVKIAACGVCHSDLHVMKGEIAFPMPCVLGHEVSGIVAELGPAVGNVGIGDRVVCSFIMPCGDCYHCWRGQEELCEQFFSLNRLKGQLYDGTSRLRRRDGSPVAMYSMGGMAEYAVVPATDVFAIPDSIPLRDAAVLGCAMFTAFGAVRHGGDIRPGDTMAVVAAGGVGSSIVQLGRAFGAATIIAIDLDDEKLSAAKALGATHTVNSGAMDALDAVREITGGRGVDVAFEAFGHPATFATAVSVVRDGGRAVMVGLAPAGVSATIPITPLVRREITIRGSYGARPRTDMPKVIDLAARGAIDLAGAVTQRFSLDDVDEAYQRLARGTVVGRAVIEIDPELNGATP